MATHDPSVLPTSLLVPGDDGGRTLYARLTLVPENAPIVKLEGR